MWRKSSHSGEGDAHCVEVGAWRKSSRSANNGACVEVGAWRKSGHSANNGACVEVGACDCCGTGVRDSKDPDGGKLAFSVGAWRVFHADVLAGRYDLP
ncbi:DUF397 domain-containing protein [Actinomadura sp. 1N219]|uniref:DUF397 domain-containing protein n=1 Tax=Actinomadura sp. 1N219 TaxID=3375152 RepID=UPI00378CE72B